MKPLLKSNILESFDSLKKMNFSLPFDLIEKKGDINSSHVGLRFCTLAILNPCFSRKKNNEISSIQEDYFGIYALKKIIAHTFFSIPFLKAALEPESIPNTPGILLHYRGCFHLVIAYLALSGRVLIDDIHGVPYVESPNRDDTTRIAKIKPITSCGFKTLDNCPGYIMAILTKSNEWKFEARNRSHKSIWRELKPIFRELKEIPSEFINILDYLTSYGPYVEEDEKRVIEDGLERIAEARHMAAYIGYGSDDFAVDQLMEGNIYIRPNALDRKLRTYKDFSKKLLTSVSLDLINLIESIKNPENVISRFVFLMLSSPLVDIMQTPRWVDSSEIRERLNNVSAWLVAHLSNKSFPIK